MDRISLILVDDGSNLVAGNETPPPDSPEPESPSSIKNDLQSPSPVLAATTIDDEGPNTGGIEIRFVESKKKETSLFSCSDSLRTIFFVTAQTSTADANDETSSLFRPLTIEIGAMHLIEKENDSDESTDMLKYSSITLAPNNEKWDDR